MEEQIFGADIVEVELADSSSTVVDSASLEVKGVIIEEKPVVISNANANKVISHTVRRGETLNGIADKYGVTIREIMDWNNMSSTRLNAGQRLKIGGKAATTQSAPKPVIKYYSVRSGDTFSTVARRHGLTQTQLKSLNSRVNVDRLDIGQKLRVK